MKKIVSLCLAAILLAAAFGVSALAESPGGLEMPRLEKFYPTDDAIADESNNQSLITNIKRIYISGNYAGGYQRYAYFKFDLTKVRENAEKVTFTVTAASDKADTLTLGLFTVPDTSWTEDNLTFSAADRSTLGDAANAIATIPSIKFGNRRTVDITQTVKDAKAAGQQQMTLVLRNISTAGDDKSRLLYLSTKEHDDRDFRPFILVSNPQWSVPELKSNRLVLPFEDSSIDEHPDRIDGGMAAAEKVAISRPLQGRGYFRFYFMKFDLRDAAGRDVKKATLSLTSTNDLAVNSSYGVYATDNTAWEANGLTCRNRGTLPEFLDNLDNQIFATQGWAKEETKTIDISAYIKEKLEAGQYQFTLALRNIDVGIDNAYASFYTAWTQDAAKRPGIAILFDNEPMEVIENTPFYPSDDAGISSAAPDDSQPEAVEAAVGGENYFFTKLDLRELEQDAGNIQMALTGKADSAGTYGVYVQSGADWNEYNLTYNNAPLDVFAQPPAATFRLPRAGAERRLDLTDTLLPLLSGGERVFTVAVKRMDENEDGFRLNTKESDTGSPYFLIRYKKAPPQGGELDPSRIEPVDSIWLDGSDANKDKCMKGEPTFAITGTLLNNGYPRRYVMKYDLNDLPGRVKKATLHLTSTNSLVATKYGVYVGNNTNWTSEGATYNNFDKAFFQSKDNWIASFTGISNNSAVSIDVTAGINRGMMDGDGVVTLGIRNVDEVAGNPWAEFHSNAAAAEERRPHLSIELYDETQPVAVGNITLRRGNTVLNALQPGVVTVRANIGYTQLNDAGAEVYVIFALCRGTEASYRVVDVQEQRKKIYDIAGSELQADFQVQEGEFVKLFVWNREGIRMVGQPSVTIQ